MQKRLMNENLYIHMRETTIAAKKVRSYSGSFADTLFELMRVKKMSRARLSIEANLSEKTIQRLRNDDDYEPNKQTVIALCIGLKLNPTEAFALIEKSPFRLRPSNPQDAVYLQIISSEKNYCIEEVNECLEAIGLLRLGQL